jgi:beta-glucosidase
MALSAIAKKDLALAEHYAEQMGAAIAQEAQAIGLNWVLAPVVDVNNNPDNPVINVRAFGDTPEVVSKLATAFIRGCQRHPVLTAAKHFPGHGDTAIDSHLELPILNHTLERLQQVELPPFKAAIAAGVNAVMSAHLQIPSLDPEYPATLSHQVLTELLRYRLNFDGLVVTDALIMGAIANRYGANQAPVMAVEAGADILLMPIDPEGAIQAVCKAVEEGRISAERIRASVERIWNAKQKVGSALLDPNTSHAWENASPALETQSITSTLAQAEAVNAATDILRNSMQIYLPTSSRLSDANAKKYRNLVIVDDVLSREFLAHHTPAIAFPKELGYQLQVVDNNTPNLPSEINSSQKNSKDWQPTLLQLFIRGNPFRGSAGSTQIAQKWFQFLLKSDQLMALVIYGSPYALEQFLPDLPTDVPYLFTYGQMPEAQAIALNALFKKE